jgi:hypothetical protein
MDTKAASEAGPEDVKMPCERCGGEALGNAFRSIMARLGKLCASCQREVEKEAHVLPCS